MKFYLVLLLCFVTLSLFADNKKVEREYTGDWGKAKLTIFYPEELEGKSFTEENSNREFARLLLEYDNISKIGYVSYGDIDSVIEHRRDSERVLYQNLLYIAYKYSYCEIELTENGKSTDYICVWVTTPEDKKYKGYFDIFSFPIRTKE